MAITYYIDKYSREHCFTCPLPDCLGRLNSQCPIYKAQKLEGLSKFTISQIAEQYEIPRQNLINWIYYKKIPSQNLTRARAHNMYLIPETTLPRIEQLVAAYKQHGHTRGV